jgi:hypothetical protein
VLQYWKQFLYVSLLMVFVGPFRDPFFMRDKNAMERGRFAPEAAPGDGCGGLHRMGRTV